MTRLVLPTNIGTNILPQIGKAFSNIFKSPVATKAGNTARTVSRNIAITSGGIAATSIGSSLFLTTEQGQNSLKTLDNITNLGGDITGFLSKNPIVPIGLLILGGLIVVSVIKK